MRENLNENLICPKVNDISSVIDYLACSIEYAGKMLGSFMRFDTDENGNIVTPMNLNFESLDELLFQCKKISSKADMLQNKVSELKKSLT